MERGASHSLRRPRTHASRKPCSGPHLFFKIQKVNGLQTSHQSELLMASAPPRKAAFLQDIAAPGSHCRKEISVNGPSHGCRANKSSSKSEAATQSQTAKASYRGDRQKGVHDAEDECFEETREACLEIGHGNGNGTPSVKQMVAVPKSRHAVNTKDLNQLARQRGDNKVCHTPDLLSCMQSHRKRVVPKKFLNDGIAKARCVGQKDSSDTSHGQNYSRNSCTKHTVELVPKSELGLISNRKLNNKCPEDRVLKKGSSFKVGGSAYLSDDGACLIRGMDKTCAVRELLCHPEARRHQHNAYAQEIASGRDDGQNCGEESSGEDAVSGSNEQSTPELEQCAFTNCGSENGGAVDVNSRGELQAPMVRKSSRIPKKRIFDGDEVVPLRRQRKKLESEPAVKHTEEESTGAVVNGQLVGECTERDAVDVVSDDQFVNECCEREGLNSNKIAEPFLDGKKELPLTARQRALRISKEGGDPEVSSCVGFPDLLQPAVPKRQREILTEAEQAIKKEEAARRRKQQMEKNAKEIQAVAIQKILGQESSRKKREEKLQKQRQEIEQEKQAAAMAPAVNSIRWVMGPSGNIVSFSQDVELPKIFSGPCSYPQEREKCAGPSCNNAYKYRDSKTRLPLCSLQCYRAVQELPSTGPAF